VQQGGLTPPLKPKLDLTDEERAAAQARFQRRLKEMTSASKA
jgi:hypothetical protein